MLLDKTFYMPRSVDQTARNRIALEKLLAGSLQPGELFAIVTGQPMANIAMDGPGEYAGYGVPPQAQQAGNSSGRRITARDGSVGRCLDCGGGLLEKGEQLHSQPKRCRPCGQAKRREHNRTQTPQPSRA